MKNIINQIFEIESKLNTQEKGNLQRNFERLYYELEQKGYKIVNPIGQTYDERDLSIEANLLTENGRQKITKVLKPVVYHNVDGVYTLIQKAVVIVE
ncbi:hypothetical protein [Pedobacter nanyangensis]|uniref:hypothetical protein n=1 Tax=Pedobacter nanyangensis TaxID=1562389 RepID=UPI000DE57A3E|nr:hypothetical protein [Pedobacter nanyangensis]